ncbi:MAG: class I SAM-dependent methyltransferase [Pseudomonadota bacterium]
MSDQSQPATAGTAHPDKSGYDEYYKDNKTGIYPDVTSPDALIERFSPRLKPFWEGGPPRGYMRAVAVERLMAAAEKLDRPLDQVRVLEAGCGNGALSVYLASRGLNMFGVDVSTTAIESARELAERVGVADRCHFVDNSLEDTTLEPLSVDFVIGINSLHHFIKYRGVTGEFMRVMKPGATAWFADPFGENKLYHVFHDKEKMERLGDVILTEPLVRDFFTGFDVTLTPVDWFTMLDKLNRKLLPKGMKPALRKLSRLHFALDRRISTSSRLALRLSGSIVTEARKPA